MRTPPPALSGVEEPAAGGLVFDAGAHARIAVDHADEGEGAGRALGQGRAGGGHRGLGVEADGAVAEFAACGGGGGEHGVEFGERPGEGFFAEDVVVGGEGHQRHGRVEARRDSDDGDVVGPLGCGEHRLGRVEEGGLGEGATKVARACGEGSAARMAVAGRSRAAAAW